MIDKCETCMDCQPVSRDGPGCLFAIAVLLLFSCLLAGCFTPEQASRATSATNGDIEPTVKTEIGEKAHDNSVSIKIELNFGDGAIASADSSGSTETQTQTPTFDISPKTDLRYNDAMAAASVTSRGILETLTAAGANKVLALMSSGGTGTVEVEKKDGTTATVECKDGQCSVCTDCTP